VFRADLLRRAYRDARESGIGATDDASLVERLNMPVRVVTGERTNVKVTTPEDLAWVEWFLTQCR
jgi:2-C-methyl-D-erythritol 4-phosphate cytidylyltransferase